MASHHLVFQRKLFAFLFVSFLERMKCVAQEDPH